MRTAIEMPASYSSGSMLLETAWKDLDFVFRVMAMHDGLLYVALE